VGHAIILVTNTIADGNRLLEGQSVEERLQIGSILTGLVQPNLKLDVGVTPTQFPKRAQELVVSLPDDLP